MPHEGYAFVVLYIIVIYHNDMATELEKTQAQVTSLENRSLRCGPPTRGVWTDRGK